MKNKDKLKQQKKKRELLKDLFKKNMGNWRKNTEKNPTPQSFNKTIA